MKKKMVLAAFVAGGILSAQAELTMYENFERAAVGTLIEGVSDWSMGTIGGGSIASGSAVVASGTSRAARFVGTADVHEEYTQNLGAGIKAQGTVFFQVVMGQQESDGACTFVMADAARSATWLYAGAIIFDREGIRVKGNQLISVGSFTAGETYSVWMVPNAVAKTFDVHIQGGSEYAEQTLLAAGMGYRNTNISTIDRAGVIVNRDMSGNDYFDVDNIYIDSTGKNLVNPVSDPASSGMVLSIGEG